MMPIYVLVSAMASILFAFGVTAMFSLAFWLVMVTAAHLLERTKRGAHFLEIVRWYLGCRSPHMHMLYFDNKLDYASGSVGQPPRMLPHVEAWLNETMPMRWRTYFAHPSGYRMIARIEFRHQSDLLLFKLRYSEELAAAKRVWDEGRGRRVLA